MKEAIRLTNKTAIALRRSAKKVRTAYFAAAVIISMLLGAAGVALGLMWLPAVPLMVAAIALIDAALMTASRSRYLELVGQAICTEAAAREIHAGKSESLRREQAISDLMRVKADLSDDEKKAAGAQPFFEEENDEPNEWAQMELPGEADEPAAPRRRRRQANLQLIRSSEAK